MDQIGGFLALIGRAASPVSNRDALEAVARTYLGSAVRSTSDGVFSLLTAGNTTFTRHGQTVRGGHGSAARSVHSDASFAAWRDAQQGGFSVLEFAPVVDELRVARDRFGAVPVYFRRDSQSVAISTSRRLLQALFAPGAVDDHALLETVRFRWQTGRRTLDREISQLLPGEELRVSGDGTSLHYKRWAPLQFQAGGSTEMAVQSSALHTGLAEGIGEHFASATQPAILLSGGVDSSVIAAIAREVRPDVRCFIATVNSEDGAEELRRARFVAHRLGLPLQEIPVDSARFATDVRRIVHWLEEPPRNPNNLILLQLYEAMRDAGVDRVLNGDGAEMLLGLADTERVARFVAKSNRVAWIPRRIRIGTSRQLRGQDHPLAWRLAAVLDTSRAEFSAGLDELAYSTSVRRAIRRWMADDSVDQGCPWRYLLESTADQAAFEDGLHEFQCMTVMLSSQRRHEVLARACQIEAATPFAHTSALRVATNLPRALRYTTRSRPVLKHLCDTLVHPDIARWHKLGFSVPWSQWLDGSLASVADEATRESARRELLPPSVHALGGEQHDPEWRWTLMTLSLVLAGSPT